MIQTEDFIKDTNNSSKLPFLSPCAHPLLSCMPLRKKQLPVCKREPFFKMVPQGSRFGSLFLSAHWIIQNNVICLELSWFRALLSRSLLSSPYSCYSQVPLFTGTYYSDRLFSGWYLCMRGNDHISQNVNNQAWFVLNLSFISCSLGIIDRKISQP